MDKQWLRIFGAGALATLLILGLFLFAKRGEHLEPTGTVLKERTIELNETTSLLLLDVRLVNDSDVVMTVNRMGMSIVGPDGAEAAGRVLGRSDLNATFGYYPLLGEKFNPALSFPDEIPARSKVDRMIAASFDVPLKTLDARQKVTLKVEDASGAAAELTGK